MEKKQTIGQMADAQKVYSRTHFGLCKNKGCENQKRKGSSYCQDCSNSNKDKK